jgi:tRNA uridine 5-carbamoylmethylation protein Kti12
MQTGEIITTPQPPPTLILLNGFPGVGKYTTARALKSSLTDQYPSVPTILVDNHLLLDPVAAVYPERDLAYYTFRRKYRRAEFLQLKDIDPKTI